jgi:putative addiction module killer protein
VIEIRQTETFAVWFRNLRDRRAKARILVRIDRLSLGNPGDAKPVGEGCRSFGSITAQAIEFISSVVATR